MSRQWHVTGTVNGARFEFDVLAQDEEQARKFAREQMSDWSTGNERFTSVTPTGYVLVHESELQRKGRKHDRPAVRGH